MYPNELLSSQFWHYPYRKSYTTRLKKASTEKLTHQSPVPLTRFRHFSGFHRRGWSPPVGRVRQVARDLRSWRRHCQPRWSRPRWLVHRSRSSAWESGHRANALALDLLCESADWSAILVSYLISRKWWCWLGQKRILLWSRDETKLVNRAFFVQCQKFTLT